MTDVSATITSNQVAATVGSPTVNATLAGKQGPKGDPGAAELVGFKSITVSTTAPDNPGVNDIWIDISA